MDSLALSNVQQDLNGALRKAVCLGESCHGSNERGAIKEANNAVNGSIHIIRKGDTLNYIRLAKLGPGKEYSH